MYPDLYNFLSVTKGIHVKGAAFLKPVKVQLPLEQIDDIEEIENQEHIEYVFFRFDGEDITQLTEHKIQRWQDTIITHVDKFSG